MDFPIIKVVEFSKLICELPYVVKWISPHLYMDLSNLFYLDMSKLKLMYMDLSKLMHGFL